MVTLYDNLIRVEMKPHEPGHGPKMLQSKPALSTVKEMYRKILQTRMIKVALMVGGGSEDGDDSGGRSGSGCSDRNISGVWGECGLWRLRWK